MLKTTVEHYVKTFECGPDKNIRINNLLLLFQEAAHVSAENLGFGYADMVKNNRVWVLSNLKLQFLSFPEWMDNIEVQTWPCGFNRLLAFRDYIVNDSKGNRCINATSDWLAIDIDSRKPFNMNDFRTPLPQAEERAMSEPLTRLNPKRMDVGNKIAEIKVPYSSIDENGHVNNSEYVKWTLDAMKANSMRIDNFSSLQISFLSEVFENDTCEIFFSESGNVITLYGKKSDTGEFIFALKIELMEKKVS
jgi:medium-chain acyl-[acyl-carrier-protein] hydrolase